MAKAKKKNALGANNITLEVAKACIKMTANGKQRLDLSHKKISVFPECLLELTNVHELDLSRNLLKDVPDYIDRFGKLNLLDLHSNYIKKLPETIGNLPELHHLNLCNNHLVSSAIPAQMGQLKGLVSLNLGMNQLDEVPPCIASLHALEELGLFDNKLTVVPDSVQKLLHLRKLNIKGNPVAATDQPRKEECVTLPNSLYLVREDSLCKQCLYKCHEERQRLDRHATASRGKPRYTGLQTPNSVAQQK